MIDAYNTTLYKYFIKKEEVDGKQKYVIKEEEVDAIKVYTDNETLYFTEGSNNNIKQIGDWNFVDKFRDFPYRLDIIYSERSNIEQAADIFIKGLHGNINDCKIAIDRDTEMLRNLYKDM